MAIISMKKMHLLGLKKEKTKILKALQKTGMVEVINIEEEEPVGDYCDVNIGAEVQTVSVNEELNKELQQLESKLSELKFGIDFFKTIC